MSALTRTLARLVVASVSVPGTGRPSGDGSIEGAPVQGGDHCMVDAGSRAVGRRVLAGTAKEDRMMTWQEVEETVRELSKAKPIPKALWSKAQAALAKIKSAADEEREDAAA